MVLDIELWHNFQMKILLLLFSFISIQCYSQDNNSYAHYNEKKEEFFNPELSEQKGLNAVLRWLWTREPKKWPQRVENNFKPDFKIVGNDNIAVTYINHSTFYIQIGKYSILTDPVFSERVSPLSWVGPKRVRDPGADLDSFPKVDFIIISHNHYDHLDIESLKLLSKKYNSQIIVPLKVKALFEEYEIPNITELDWWEEKSFFQEIKFIFTPAQHFSSRGLFDRFETLWGGHLIQVKNQNIFFAGDTGYATHFKQIQKRFKHINLAFLPIGAYEPRWFMKDMHMNPEDAVLAHRDLNSNLSIGMHFGTFQLTDEAIHEPVEALNIALDKYKILRKNFKILNIGQTNLIKLNK